MQQKTCFQIDAKIIKHNVYDGGQNIIRLEAPKISKISLPGNFVHIQCDSSLLLRRPISIMTADKVAGTIDLLYKTIGTGTKLLADKKVGQKINILGPLGKPFTIASNIKKPLLIGGGVGMPPMIFLSQFLKDYSDISPLVILGSEIKFPFDIKPSTIMINGIKAIGTMPLLADWGIACRLASRQEYPGVFQGLVTDLARLWLDSLNDETLNQVAIYSCGPHPMLEAVHKLSKEYNIPCKISLEEFMACGVGGCASCTVPVKTDNGIAMKRVCVDGPIFESSDIFFEKIV